MLGNLLTNVSSLARQAAPLIGAGAALSSGGQSTFLTKAATASSILGGLGGSQQGQSVAVDRAQAPPSETAMSGETGGRVTNIITTPQQQPQMMPGVINASYGGNVPMRRSDPRVQQANLPAIISGGARALQGMGGMLGLAGGALMAAPIILDPITGEEKKLRVTRKLKSSVKKAVEMFGVEFVAEQMGTDINVIFYILTKRMRNDGPAITKAALRKTRSTMRKLDAMCDMRDKMRPPARRAPARRTTSKVMQIKN